MAQNARSHENYDVIVVGGGPAGATAATLVAKEGHRVLLLDRDEFPRYHIGESLMPATYWTLERLGVLENMEHGKFVPKHSVQFVTGKGRSSVPFYFSEFDSHESSRTWQVDRADFDLMLVNNARSCGVEVRLGANVRDVIFDGDRATGVELDNANGDRHRIDARVVIDASGQTGLISRRLGLKQVDPLLQNAAFFTRYKGAHRDEGLDEGATLVLATEDDRCWFWYIPLADDEVSVGVVGTYDHLLRGKKASPQEVYDEQVARCPGLQQRIARGTRSMDVRVLRDFSYISERIAGDGWVMAGDAFGFLDPIYSTGVFLALKSGEMAADSVNAAFEKGDLGAAQLGDHGECYLYGMEAMRKLVYGFYDEGFHFAGFLREHPECREDVVNLLVGNVFRRPVKHLFEAMAEVCELPESRRLAPHPAPS